MSDFSRLIYSVPSYQLGTERFFRFPLDYPASTQRINLTNNTKMVFWLDVWSPFVSPLQMSIERKSAAYQENTFNNNNWLASDSFIEQANVYKNFVFPWLQVWFWCKTTYFHNIIQNF